MLLRSRPLCLCSHMYVVASRGLSFIFGSPGGRDGCGGDDDWYCLGCDVWCFCFKADGIVEGKAMCPLAAVSAISAGVSLKEAPADGVW